MLEPFRTFLRLESAGGIMLVAAAAVAMALANSPASGLYEALLSTRAEVRVGSLGLSKPLLLWVNDGLMAVFFLLVGLELKREVLEGELSNRSQLALPALAAVGGMVVPALIYLKLNLGDSVSVTGWAIPTATDIAFALGVLALLGPRVPASLKIYLLTLAILDDLGAIVIIALVYTVNLSVEALVAAGVCIAILATLNRCRVSSMSPYLFIGFVLWVAVLKSGVHATLAGVVLALFIPLASPRAHGASPLRRLEEDLHPVVAFAILPIFAFANAGVSLSGLSLSDLAAPVPLGIAAGLFLGKQIGVFGMSWLAIRLGLAVLPAGSRWLTLYGVSVLCGIGFTMSLFVSSLAFDADAGATVGVGDRLGILTGSLLSAIVGYTVLAFALPKRAQVAADRAG